LSKVRDAAVDPAKDLDPSTHRRPKLTLASLVLVLCSVGLAATGQLMLKTGMKVAAERAAADGGSLAIKAATSPFVIFGLMIFAVSAVTWLATLSRVPLSIAYPFNALGFIIILIMSSILLNERTNIWTWVGTVVVVSGLILVVTTKPPSDEPGSAASAAAASSQDSDRAPGR
jgi:undecaprenyl phosphate-alpha-L-ara4N flippase subunit ArnE